MARKKHSRPEERHEFLQKARELTYRDAIRQDPKAVAAYEKQVNERMGK